MDHRTRSRSPGASTLVEAAAAAAPAGPGKRSRAADVSPGALPGHGLGAGPGGGFGAAPAEGLGGGPDPTLDPEHDDERSSLDLGAATEQDGAQRNPRVDGRPIDPTKPDGWGSRYGDCHGIPAFKNVEPDAAERARIAALHDGGLAGADQFGLTVPFGGALAYQCVEFVGRYYRDALGHSGIGSGHAQSFLQGSRGGLEVHRFPSPTRPQAGDLVVQEAGLSPVGHVGIVQSVSGDGASLAVAVVQQNWGASSPVSTFTVTSRKVSQNIEGGASREVDVYETSSDWSGFRRKPGTTPVAERGGASQSQWLSGGPDLGQGNYRVQPGQTVYLSDLSRIYGVTLAELRALNPGIPDAVVVPAGGAPIEIRVTAGPEADVATIGTVVVSTSGNIRPSASTTAASIGSVDAGDVLRVREVVQGGEVAGYTTRTWYKIVFYTGADAYVFGGLCGDLRGAATGGP